MSPSASAGSPTSVSTPSITNTPDIALAALGR